MSGVNSAKNSMCFISDFIFESENNTTKSDVKWTTRVDLNVFKSSNLHCLIAH